jgi:hypothetical protein
MRELFETGTLSRPKPVRPTPGADTGAEVASSPASEAAQAEAPKPASEAPEA